MKKPIIGISGSELTKNVGPFVGYRRSYVLIARLPDRALFGLRLFAITFRIDILTARKNQGINQFQLRLGYVGILIERNNHRNTAIFDDRLAIVLVFDMQLLKLAEKRGISVLGICRGAQLINVFHGGSLYQDLKYYPVPTLKHWQGDTPWWQATHQVKLVKDTHLAAIFDQVPRLRVNSYHHQLIKKVGKGL